MGEQTYPGIVRATVLMALDNGCINRERSEENLTRDLYNWLNDEAVPEFGYTPSMLAEIDAWLAQRTDEQLELVCCGEEGEALTATADAPLETDLLLTTLFMEVL